MDAEPDRTAAEDQGPAGRLFNAVRRNAHSAAERLHSPRYGGGHGPERPSADLSGLLSLTLRLWRVNVGVLIAVGFIGSAVSLLAAAALEGVHSPHAFSGMSLIGLTILSGGDGVSVRLHPSVTLTFLIAGAATAWVTATMVTMLLTHVRSGTRPRLRDLGCGLPSWGWVALIVLGENLVLRLASVAGALWLGLLPFSVLARLAVGTAFFTVFLLYAQVIVGQRRDALDALAGSWRLVVGAGFWRVLGNYLLFVLCLSPIMVATVLLSAHFHARGLAEAQDQVVFGVVVGPLSAAFLTALYLLARGDRAAVEAVVGAAGE